MHATHVAHTKPLSRIQSLAKSRGGQSLQNLFLVIVQSAIRISLQCRHILGGRSLVRGRNIVVATIFDFMTVEDWGE